jgi:hypothetical protein
MKRKIKSFIVIIPMNKKEIERELYWLMNRKYLIVPEARQ